MAELLTGLNEINTFHALGGVLGCTQAKAPVGELGEVSPLLHRYTIDSIFGRGLMRILKNILLIAALLGSGVIYAAPVNINTATAVEIAESLNGIGEARAAAIVTYREKNGPFMSADQLLQVKGVGEKTLEKNLDNIMVKSAE